ncbi:mortality factor 4-like protein 2 [Mastomys coucha]|uniref:mortality factor 4-like protein 2 n=1 Tax=Mastomys coucha TaxID=35658 RepID=UPI001261743C|nr:mortality factor 4-like protein 2 [Mastomys coucha]
MDLREGMRTLQEEVVPKIVILKRNFAPLEGVNLQKEVPLQEKITPLAEVGLQRKAAQKGTVAQQKGIKTGVELKVPDVLKSLLFEDWDLVNKQKQLFQLPAEKNVDNILAEYGTFVKSQGLAGNREYSVDEVVFGLREYFNKILNTKLLCQFERPQHAEIRLAYPDLPMSQVYGAPHLLRLLVKIGSALAHSQLHRQSLLLVSGCMRDFLDYLAENSTSLFNVNNYKVASAAYCCKAL